MWSAVGGCELMADADPRAPWHEPAMPLLDEEAAWVHEAAERRLELAHPRFSHRKAAATPAAASSPAPIAASVAGTTFSWIGDSACAGRP